MRQVCDCLERDMYNVVKENRVSLDGHRPQIRSRVIRLLARQRINYVHFIRVFTQMERTKAAWDRAASNGVAKTGCAPRRIASLGVHAHMDGFNSLCLLPAFIVRAHSNEIATEHKAQFT